MTPSVHQPFRLGPWRRAARSAPGFLVLAVLCAGLLSPGLHELGHGDEVWSIARQSQAECAQHPDGVHVETGFSHLNHAPCVLCSRTGTAGTVATCHVGIQVEWTRLVDVPRTLPAGRFHPSSVSRGPPALV